ncbi:MAG: hypothetical protein KIS85_01205 [Anaerolineales bacterium]|nr:hypothetical protein [Anaerolineales bacterium]
MEATPSLTSNPTHAWLRSIGVAFAPGPMTPLLSEFSSALLERFAALGHTVSELPGGDPDVLFTTAAFGEPIPWREALFFSARRKFGLKRSPVVYNIIQISPAQFDEWMERFGSALVKDPPAAEDFQFEGLSPTAHKVLIEQGLRGGPILSLARMLQAQAKSIRILLLVGEERPERVYHFDLVGAYPASHNTSAEAFYSDIVLRIVTTESTTEVTNHELIEPTIEFSEWEALSSPEAMRRAGNEIGARGFFTDMVRIEDLVQVPAVNEGVAKQYSEGCFATWDARIYALIATVTGSARPVHKGRLTDDDLAVIVGVRGDGSGAQVRHVDGKRNDPPSSEAVEMMDMDELLPKVAHETIAGVQSEVPVIRSKLHGHRGVKAFNPELVEYVPLDPPYYHYLVSCATEAQARGIKAAFSRAQSLLNPDDPRQIAFTVLPGHGVVMAEKWQKGKAPFEIIWEAMDSGELEIDPHVPQGVMDYLPGEDGRHYLKEK